MEFTTGTCYRGTGLIANQTMIGAASSLELQIDTVSLDMRDFDKGASPYDLFNIFVMYGSDPGVKRNDHIVSDSNGKVYTVSALPETFPDGHTELQCLSPVGT